MMLPPAVDFPPPSPAHRTARPDSSPRSVISQGSQVTTRVEVPDVSPKVNAESVANLRGRGGDGGSQGGDRHTALVRRGAQLLSGDELASNGVLVCRSGNGDLRGEQLAHRAGPVQRLLLRRGRHGETEPAARASAQPRQTHRDVVLDRKRLVSLAIQGTGSRLLVLHLVVVLLRTDLLDVSAHRCADLRGVLDLHPTGPLDREAELVGALHPRDASGDLQVGHPPDRQDADMSLDAFVARLPR